MEIQKVLGAKIKKIRSAANLSQEELAGRMGNEIDQAYVSRLEAGELNPTLLTLSRLSKALNVKISELFSE